MKTFKDLDEERKTIDAISGGIRWPWVFVNIPAIGFILYRIDSFFSYDNWFDLFLNNAFGLLFITSFIGANYNGYWLRRYYAKYPETLWTNSPWLFYTVIAFAIVGHNAVAVWQILF